VGSLPVGVAININLSFYNNGLQNNHIPAPQSVPQCDFNGIVVSKVDDDFFALYWRRL
jgi:hypothetical protein